ncbi:MOP flippase family protein [Sphingobacterium arenae]|uniref:MOP flippase family protein n=1 Tax=Sphingobacterium arenae TaxID=1280598 RepID=A0ABR7Y8V3_9SPHI|nr:MOP flippase family protein [Sphingobacterium arenae]MBD1427743.1 MOP flippase family protein [Sphingobacterium arenae]
MSFNKKAVSGVKWTTASSLYVSITQVLQIIILSKILSPKDFGLMAILVFLINFSNIFIDLGLANAVIYKKEVSRIQLSTLFYTNILVGVFIFLIMYFSSALISSFYDEHALEYLVKFISVVFLIIPLGQQYQALLRKNLDFKSLALRDIISRTASFVVVIALAYQGKGIMSLVWGTIVYNLLSTVLLINAGKKLFAPSFLFAFSSISELLRFGFFQMGEKIVNYLNKEVDTLIIGKLVGLEALGLYNIAKDFISKPYQIINPILTKVSFPLMAKVQDNLIAVKDIYMRLIKYLSVINSIVFMFCLAFAQDVILLFFGEKWINATPILQILSVYMLIRSISNPVGSLQLALGKPDLGFYWNLALLFIVPVFVYVGSFWGIIGVSIALLACQIALYYPSWKYMVNNLITVSFVEFNKIQVSSWISAGVACLAAHLGMSLFEISNVIIRFFSAGVFSVILFLILLQVTDRKIIKELKIFLVKK